MAKFGMKKILIAASCSMVFAGAANATLVDLGDGTVKDTTTSLIWMKDWNSSGLADWSTQMSWAENLNFAGSADWVLPSVDQFIDLFNEYGFAKDIEAFSGVAMGGVQAYWTSNLYPPIPYAALFVNSSGVNTFAAPRDWPLHAVAVRQESAGNVVPEPGTAALVSFALLGLAVRRKWASRVNFS